MQKFFFQAVTAEGKQISGYVSAESLDAAREKLKAGALSILTLEAREETGEGLAQGLQVFEFEAINTQHKPVSGTIEATEMYEAYKKLRLEYSLEVSYLVPSIMAPSEKEKARKAGIPKDLETRLGVEIKLIEKKNKKKNKHPEKGDEIKEAVEANEEERQFMVDKIDSVLNEVVPLLEENAEFIDGHKKREIEERINLLMRLKHSNSVAHLKSLTQRLLEQISSDEIFLKDANIPAELREEMARRKGQFQAVGNRFDKAISKGLLDLQVQLASIDTDALRQTVKDIRPIQRVTNTFYLVFFFLFAFCSVFLLFSALFYALDVRVEQTTFFLHSPLVWYVWGLGLVMMGSFYFLRFYPKKEWYEGLVVVASTAVAFIVYTVQFPIVFFWT